MQSPAGTSPDRDGIYPVNGQTYDKYHFQEKNIHMDDIDLDDEEEDEDIDQLIEDLESQDGENADYEEEEAQQPGGARLIPEELLQTDTRIGLTSAEVLIRRKKFGENKMKGTNTSTPRQAPTHNI
jgi:H+-transporting ATPase